jgi:small subunit ribosomal protein S16
MVVIADDRKGRSAAHSCWNFAPGWMTAGFDRSSDMPILTTAPVTGRSLHQESHVIKLRLRRTGAKKRPSYRIVAAEHSSPRDGRFIEILGHYDPLTEPATVKVNAERVNYWLSVGAQPSETVAGLLKRAGVTGGDAAPEAAVADAS